MMVTSGDLLARRMDGLFRAYLWDKVDHEFFTVKSFELTHKVEVVNEG